MEDTSHVGRRGHLFRISTWCAICLLSLLAGAVAAAPRKTNFVHNVGFSFDYPSKWSVKRLDEGLMLAPHDVGRDAAGRPLEVIVIGFVDAGATDPFDPSFADAFDRHYRSLVPQVSRVGDMDWLETSSMGLGLLMPFEDQSGSPHKVYCAVHGELGIFLAHVARSRDARPKDALVREIFSSFSWTETILDPALVRSWTDAPPPADQPVDRWVFAEDGRLRRAAGELSRGMRTPDTEHGGFYSSSGGVLNIVWDHGIEESYLYTVSKRPEGGPQLELRSPGGEPFQLY